MTGDARAALAEVERRIGEWSPTRGNLGVDEASYGAGEHNAIDHALRIVREVAAAAPVPAAAPVEQRTPDEVLALLRAEWAAPVPAAASEGPPAWVRAGWAEAAAASEGTGDREAHEPVIGRFGQLQGVVGCSCMNTREWHAYLSQHGGPGWKAWSDHLADQFRRPVTGGLTEAIEAALRECDRAEDHKRHIANDEPLVETGLIRAALAAAVPEGLDEHLRGVAQRAFDRTHPPAVPTPGQESVEHYAPTHDTTPEHGLSWRDGLDTLDALLDDCSQIGEDYQNHVRVSAVRDIVKAVRRYEDDTDEAIRSALMEDAIEGGYDPEADRARLATEVAPGQDEAVGDRAHSLTGCWCGDHHAPEDFL